MSLLLGPMRKHIHGYKELTDHKPVLVCPTPEVVAIPLMAMGNPNVEVYVQEGDRVLVNQKIASRNDHFVIPLFSSVSGTVKGFKEEFHSWGGRKAKHILIENDGKYEAVAPTPLDDKKATKDEICEHIKMMGIVGCGGAGFPAYMKYQPMKQTDVLIINAVECEPYLTGDYITVNSHLEELVHGTNILQKAGNCSRVLVCIKEDKKESIAKLKEAFREYPSVTVRPVPNVYPMGWERTLVYEVLKKRYDRLPSEVGAIVNNSTTAIMVSRAFRKGTPITSKIVTVSGNGIKEPQNVEVKLGTPLKDVLDTCGGLVSDAVHVLHGGPMMGKAMINDQVTVNFTTNALTVIIEEKIDPIACLRCGACVEHCPAGLMPVKIQDAEKAKNLDMMAKLDANSCIECGLCTYVCPSKIDVTENVRRAKSALRLRN